MMKDHRMESPYPKPGMSIAKAIEITGFLSTAGAPKLTLDEVDSIKLLIRAGEYLIEKRKTTFLGRYSLLPGETED